MTHVNTSSCFLVCTCCKQNSSQIFKLSQKGM